MHRGDTEADLPPSVRHAHVRFDRFSDVLDRFPPGSVDAVVDMVPYLDKGGHGLLRFGGIAERGVAITSCDVYRAFGRLWRSEPGPLDPIPLTEDSPLRSRRATDSGNEEDGYDNVEVERALLQAGLPVTILRLPATYGPGDPQHRLSGYLQRMDDRRPAIILEKRHASWRWTRGYVENVAEAIVLAIEHEKAAGRIYNVGARQSYTEAEWVRRIGEAAGWAGEVVDLPHAVLPEELRSPLDFTQDYVVDTTRIRTELGYRETIDEATALDRTIDWERQSRPTTASVRSYAAEDEALARRATV